MDFYLEHNKESGVSQHDWCGHWLLWPERQLQSPIKSMGRL